MSGLNLAQEVAIVSKARLTSSSPCVRAASIAVRINCNRAATRTPTFVVSGPAASCSCSTSFEKRAGSARASSSDARAPASSMPFLPSRQYAMMRSHVTSSPPPRSRSTSA